MKIAILLLGVSHSGGSQRQALYLARELKKRGNKVKIYTIFHYPKNFYYKKIVEGIDIKFLFKCNHIDEEDKIIFPYSFLKINNFLKLIYFKFKMQKLSKDLAKLIDKDTEILNPHDNFLYKTSCYFKKKYNKNCISIWMANDIPSLMWNVEKFGIEKISFINKIIRSLIDLYEKRFIRKQDKIIVLDNLNKRAVGKYFNLPAQVIRSGVDINYYLKNSFIRCLDPKKNIKILMVAVLAPHRRFEDGIMAVKSLKEDGYNISLDIIGYYKANDGYKRYLDVIIKNNKLDNLVHFLGGVSEKELLKNYLSHDIFIFPNHMQTWGLAVFEAMACGLPTIVSNTTGASEVLEHGKNVLLVSPKSPEKIAGKIRRLIDNPFLYKDISKNSIDFVKNSISWQKYTEEMFDVFKSLIKND